MSLPKEVSDALEAIVASGKEAILKKERGGWVVLENGRRLVFKEEPPRKRKYNDSSQQPGCGKG